MIKRDKKLVRRMLAGDERAFDEFFDDHFPPLFRFARSRLDKNEDAAEEVAQAAISKAITKLHTYRGEAALLSWLITFCRHEISRRCLREKMSRNSQELNDQMPSTADDPAEELVREELGEQVRNTLDHLPIHYGQALEWKYLEELPVNLIALRLRISPKAAESLLTRARNAFRDAFPAGGGLAL